MSTDCPWSGYVVPGNDYCQACIGRICARCETYPSACVLDLCPECEQADERRLERNRQRAERATGKDIERGAA